MAARKPARYLAPLALLAIAAAIALVVKDQVGSTTHTSSANTIPPALTHSRRGQAPSKRHRPKFYVVKAGDTLSGISVRTGVPVPILQTLNPGLDPNALQTGQRLRLRR